MITGQIITDVLAHFVPRRIEWLFGSIAFVLGFRLLQSGSLFWGWALFLVGALRLVALTLNGTVRGFAPYSPLTRAVTAYLTAGAWFVFALAQNLGEKPDTDAVTYFIMFLFDAFVATEIGKEAGRALRGRRDGRAS